MDARRQFEGLALPLMPSLRAAARAGVGAGHADDLLQDALLSAFRAWGRFREGTNFAAWMRCIVANLARNVRRGWAREAALRFPGPPRAPAPCGDSDLEPLRALPRPFAAAFALYAFGARSYREIAEELGVAVGTAQSRVFRAREFLRRSETA